MLGPRDKTSRLSGAPLFGDHPNLHVSKKAWISRKDGNMGLTINNELYAAIISQIAFIEKEYQRNQGLILSEDDLKCLIYERVRRLVPSKMPTTNQNIYASPLHTEIPFYDSNNQLTIRPDITVLNPKDLSIIHGFGESIQHRIKLPSKGFQFGGKVIVIEIKYYRAKSGISVKSIDSIKKDIEKMLELKRRHNRPDRDNEILGIMVVFNKTNKKPEILDELIREYMSHEAIKVVYGTGNVLFD